jgi:hypothetical protein
MDTGAMFESVGTTTEPSPPLWGRVGEGGVAPTSKEAAALDPRVDVAPRALLRSATPLRPLRGHLPHKGGGDMRYVETLL